jgi:hypothetical protein
MTPAADPTADLPRMLRRGDALALLARLGVSAKEFEKLRAANIITRIELHAGGRGYYATAQIREKIIAPLLAAEGATTNQKHTT